MALYIFSFPLPYSFIMAQHTGVGVRYRHPNLDTSLRTRGASNVVTRLKSRSITGHALPIQVHQHYGLEFHLVLTDESCIRRDCWVASDTHRICTQLERHLEGVYSCVFDEGRVHSLLEKVEPCFRAAPVPNLFRTFCDCATCTALALPSRWIAKNRQAVRHSQRDVCCCRGDYVEVID